MASASSSAARLFIRDGKAAARLLLRGRAGSLSEKTEPAIRSLLRFNQTPAVQYPVFSETFPVIQSGFRVGGGFIQQEMVSERIGKMEAGHGNKVVDSDGSDSDFDVDDDEFDDEFDDEDDLDCDDVDLDDDDVCEVDVVEEKKYTKKK